MIEIVSKFRGPWYRFWRKPVLARIAADTLEGADLRGARLAGAMLRNALLNKAILEEADLSQAELWGAKLASANLCRADLRGADLAGAVLVTANLSSSHLEGCNLWGANLAGAKLPRANLAGANLWGGRLAPADLTQATLRGAQLVTAYLWGAQLKGANLEHANLSQADLTGATLAGARLATANMERTNLAEADLCGATLDGAILRDANLQAVLADDASLQKCDLRKAKLNEAVLRGAKLTEAELRGADLTGANLEEASAQAARFTECNLKEACLAKVDFTDAVLDEADLENADLSEACLERASLAGANLKNAKLQGAKLHGANLWGANLEAADLRGADLWGATLSPGTRELSRSDDSTRWPAGTENSKPGGKLVFEGHEHPVLCLTAADREAWLASGDQSGRLILWDLNSARPIHELSFTGAVRSLSVMPGEKLLAVLADRKPSGSELRLLDVLSWREVRRLELPGEAVSLDVDRAGKEAIVTTSNGLWEASLESGEPPERMPAVGSGGRAACWVDGDQKIAVEVDREIRLFDAASGNGEATLGEPASGIVELVRDAGGYYLAWAGTNDTILVWDVADGRPIARHELGHAAEHYVLSDDGQSILTALANGELRLINAHGGETLFSKRFGEDRATCVGLAEAGALVLAGTESRIYGWRLGK